MLRQVGSGGILERWRGGKGPYRAVRYAGFALLIASVAGGVGCTGEPSQEGKEAVQSTEQALQTYEFSLSFPSGYSESNVGLYSSESLRLGPFGKLRTEANEPAAALNIGTGLLELEAEANTGSLVSGGDIALRLLAEADGDAQAAGTIDTGLGAMITGSVNEGTPLGPLTNLQFRVEFPEAEEGIFVPTLHSVPIEPGAYTTIKLAPLAEAHLRTGKYYVDELRVGLLSKLRMDTTGGPVIVYARESADFHGKVEGEARDFALVYVGTDAVSVGKPFHGTILAPNAELRLGPTNHEADHQGSFFARVINATGHSIITHEPFAHWAQLLDVRPLLAGIRRYRSPNGAALFGYENRSDVPVTIPLGPDNALVPEGEATPPTVLEPGVHPRVFWAPFDLTQGVTWTLGGESITATASSEEAALDDVLPGEEPQPQTGFLRAEVPKDVSLAALSQVAGDFESDGYSHRPTPVAGGVIPNPDPTAPFTFTVTSLNYQDSPGPCAGSSGRSQYVSTIVMGTPPLQQIFFFDEDDTPSASMEIPRDEDISIHIDVRDSGLGCDELLTSHDFTVDNYSGISGCIDDGRLCWEATPVANPGICFGFNAQFLDSGPWDGVPQEDFLASKDLGVISASFARAEVKLENANGVQHEWHGVLDHNGCVPADERPPREDWALGTDLRVTLKLLTQLCNDPSGNRCQFQGSTIGGANVIILEAGQSGPTQLCTVFAENPSSATEPNCVVKTIDWENGIPPIPVLPGYTDHTSATRAAAAMSHIFLREHETNGGLGVQRGMVDLRLDGTTGAVFLNVGEYCPGYLPEQHTSCRMDNVIYLQPDSAEHGPSTTRFKYIVAHEFGHYVQGAAQGLMARNYGAGGGASGQVARCRCDHVSPDQQQHCMQSMEEPGAAQIEGFAHFFASKVFNEDLEDDCTFVYYKPFLDSACAPGSSAEECEQDEATGLFVSKPPIPLSCRQAVRWRNTYCVDENSSQDQLLWGVEYDWMAFCTASTIIPARPNAGRRRGFTRPIVERAGSKSRGLALARLYPSPGREVKADMIRRALPRGSTRSSGRDRTRLRRSVNLGMISA